jgi:hypothetical protein
MISKCERYVKIGGKSDYKKQGISSLHQADDAANVNPKP